MTDVVIKSDLTEVIEHNSTVVLTCSAKGSFLKFIWTNGTKPIVIDGNRLTVVEVGLSSCLSHTHAHTYILVKEEDLM